MKTEILFLSALGTAALCAAEDQKPNVLFILTDDMQFDAIGALGGAQAVTPNIDRLVGQGVTFTNAYINGGITGAISMPSRAMLMTGRTLFEINGDGLSIPPSHTTMPEHFRANGYTTFATGKWHSDKESFNRSFSTGENIFFGGMHRYELNGHRSPRLHHYDPTGSYETTGFIGDKFSSQLYADAAIDFITNASESADPFFAYVAFTSPHDPRNVLPDYGYRFSHELMELPESYLPTHPFDNGELYVRDEMMVPAPRTGEDVRRELAFYYGMVSEVDVQIGRLVAAMKQSGAWDNTIIVFASDNGLAVGRHGLLGKQNLYQHSTRIPLVIISPDVPEAVKHETYCYLPDIYPTLCEMAGLPVPPSVTCHSLVNALGGGEGARDGLLLAYSSLQRAILKDGFKLIRYNVAGESRTQFFHVAEDPNELNDLAGSPHYKEKIAAYNVLLAEEMKRRGDFCDPSLPDWGWPEKPSFERATTLYQFP